MAHRSNELFLPNTPSISSGECRPILKSISDHQNNPYRRSNHCCNNAINRHSQNSHQISWQNHIHFSLSRSFLTIQACTKPMPLRSNVINTVTVKLTLQKCRVGFLGSPCSFSIEIRAVHQTAAKVGMARVMEVRRHQP